MSVIVIGVVLSIVAVVLTTFVRGIRQAVDSIPVRVLVGAHIARYIGIAFLALSASGSLSPMFGERAGFGDIAVATIALLLTIIGPGTSTERLWVFLGWNALGMLDLLAAVATAAVVTARADAPGMEPLLRMPLLLVPLVAIPVLLATHVALFRRLWATAGARA